MPVMPTTPPMSAAAEALRAQIIRTVRALMADQDITTSLALTGILGWSDRSRVGRLLNLDTTTTGGRTPWQQWTVPDLAAVADALGIGDRPDLLLRSPEHALTYLRERGE